jgi:two-component system copper resistance phosphate regulon response regulator CusR
LHIRDLELIRAGTSDAGGTAQSHREEFLLLTHLVRSAGQVVSRGEIASHVWDINFATNTNVVDVMVRRLRAKVDDPFPLKLIHTVRGAGYVLKAG